MLSSPESKFPSGPAEAQKGRPLGLVMTTPVLLNPPVDVLPRLVVIPDRPTKTIGLPHPSAITCWRVPFRSTMDLAGRPENMDLFFSTRSRTLKVDWVLAMTFDRPAPPGATSP